MEGDDNALNVFLDYQSRAPIYEQIKTQIISQIGNGVLTGDEQLPSLRQISSKLSVNINTVKRALSELEAQGIVYTVPGKGIFISGETTINVIADELLRDSRAAVTKAKNAGVSEEDMMALIKEIYKGGETLD